MHYTVMLQEAVEGLNVRADGCYVDGTFGRGGHSRAILKALGPEGRLLAIDKDPQAIAAGEAMQRDDDRLLVAQTSFAQLPQLMHEHGWSAVDGILLDLGVSSPQLDEAERGFSFLRDGPLDMRMDPACGTSAADLVNEAAETELVRIFKEYGEERYSKRIARAVVERRSKKPFSRTLDFAHVVAEAHPAWEKGKNPATRVFQALRIEVNQELADLRSLLDVAIDALQPGGRLVVISFHSLEDRMVKQFMRDQQRGAQLPKGLPVPHASLGQRVKLIGKAIKATDRELQENVRSRSAVLRIAEKL